jgi:DNA polymerase III delta prime subunit
MSIIEHLDKENLHHAYLIEGARDEIVPKIIEFCESIKIKTLGNPDFTHIVIDNFKIDEAFDLRAMSANKSFSSEKRIFLLCVNSFSLDAQNVLLKMFEEPMPNTHFFVVVPDTNVLLKTLLSRFYLIRPETGSNDATREVEKFLALSLQNRINFIKELLIEPEEKDEEGNEIAVLDSTRSKALKFLNALESILSKTVFDPRIFEHFFKVRQFLRMPGSSVKNLMESVALIIPETK